MWNFLKWFFRPKYVWTLVTYAADDNEVCFNVVGVYHSESMAREAFIRYADCLMAGTDEWEVGQEDAIRDMQVQSDNTEICIYKQKLE